MLVGMTTHTTTVETTSARVVRRGEGRDASFSDPAMPSIEVRLGAGDEAGFSLVEYVVPPRFSPPPVLHRHTREDAVVYVLEGELHYWFEDDDRTAGPGDVVHLRRGAWFRWANDTDRPARMLSMFSPAGFEQFFLDVDAGTEAAGGDRAALGPVLADLRARYGDQEDVAAGDG
jgi:quercetin dioxygenase-like cupin family protein